MKSSLLQSRKFWLMILDVIVSLVTYFVTKYAAPEMTKDILFLLTALQPVVIALIASITVQNVQHIKADKAAMHEKLWSTEERMYAAEEKLKEVTQKPVQEVPQ